LIKLVALIGYPSNSTGEYGKWENSDFSAYKMVHAIKQKSFNGYAEIKSQGANYTIRNNAAGHRDALEIVSANMVHAIKSQLGLNHASIVPVPGSSYTEIGQKFTGQRMADAIQAKFPAFVSRPYVTFNEPVQKAAEGGPRNPNDLTPLMNLGQEIPDGPVVVIDDVCSTKGHIKAVSRILRAAGREVSGVVCLAQTVQAKPEKIFQPTIQEINIDAWPGDDPGLF
tara:strand:- start:3227 stop:3904 length:678 start_codon:yes stop_codon:yes gene_type:complete